MEKDVFWTMKGESEVYSMGSLTTLFVIMPIRVSACKCVFNSKFKKIIMKQKEKASERFNR